MNQQAQELTRNSTAEQATVIIVPVREVNQRWDALQANIADRQVNSAFQKLHSACCCQSYSEPKVKSEPTNELLYHENCFTGAQPQMTEQVLAKEGPNRAINLLP